MNLREVLAEALRDDYGFGLDDNGELHEEEYLRLDREVAQTLLARLSRPDVLDEFEQRVIGVTTAPSAGGPMAPWVVARRVLSDMLGGDVVN